MGCGYSGWHFAGTDSAQDSRDRRCRADPSAQKGGVSRRRGYRRRRRPHLTSRPSRDHDGQPDRDSRPRSEDAVRPGALTQWARNCPFVLSMSPSGAVTLLKANVTISVDVDAPTLSKSASASPLRSRTPLPRAQRCWDHGGFVAGGQHRAERAATSPCRRGRRRCQAGRGMRAYGRSDRRVAVAAVLLPHVPALEILDDGVSQPRPGRRLGDGELGAARRASRSEAAMSGAGGGGRPVRLGGMPLVLLLAVLPTSAAWRIGRRERGL